MLPSLLRTKFECVTYADCNTRILRMIDGDPVDWLVVFNPDEFVPLLKDLDIYAFAEKFNDGLMPLPDDLAGAH